MKLNISELLLDFLYIPYTGNPITSVSAIVFCYSVYRRAS